MRRSIGTLIVIVVLSLMIALPARGAVPRSVRWVCLVPSDDGYTEVTFVSVPEAARDGITQANFTAGETFLGQFGEVCTVR